MIGRLRGTLRDPEAGRVVVDVAGVGYLVHVPMSTYLELPREGSEVEFLVNTQVREDSITLYGFLGADERQAFERLLTVSGVGPRIALAALSALGPAQLAEAIASGDARRLSGIPGVGRKTAERLIVDLRDKMAAPAVASGKPGKAGDAASDVVSALVNLGYQDRAAARAVAEAVQEGGKQPFDALLRGALKRLGKG